MSMSNGRELFSNQASKQTIMIIRHFSFSQLVTVALLFAYSWTAQAGTSSDRKFRWRLTNVSVPIQLPVSFGPFKELNTWYPSINDPAMFGKARLTLYPMVTVNSGETVSWRVKGPYDFGARSFP